MSVVNIDSVGNPSFILAMPILFGMDESKTLLHTLAYHVITFLMYASPTMNGKMTQYNDKRFNLIDLSCTIIEVSNIDVMYYLMYKRPLVAFL